MERHFDRPIPIGLCVLDNTEVTTRNMQWDVKKFQDLLNGIMAIAGGSMPSQYMLVVFLNNSDYIHLQCTLQNVSDIVKQ